MIRLVDVRLDHPRGGEPLVEGANLEVATGDIVMIVGASGVGTSRMVAAALGEMPATEGRIEVLGRDVGKLRRASLRLLRRRIGIVPQDLCLLEDRTAQLNVVLPLEIDGIPRSTSIARADEIMEKLALGAVAMLPIHSLSAAERQRVAVARALIRNPDVVLADHPTSLQDVEGAELVCSALAEAAGTGAAVVVFGRDPVLRAIAERRSWRLLALLDRKLFALAEISLSGPALSDLLIAAESVPVPIHTDDRASDEIPNILPFPLSARTGVA